MAKKTKSSTFSSQQHIPFLKIYPYRLLPPPSSSVCNCMEHKIVSVSVSEVVIEFALNCKCRANVVLTSLCATAGVAFKVQTSSPTKFLVNPPSGIIPPLSNITFQIVLKPQTQLPADYPRSPHDRFLVRAAKLTSSLQPHQSIASWLSSQTLGTTQVRTYTYHNFIFLSVQYSIVQFNSIISVRHNKR